MEVTLNRNGWYCKIQKFVFKNPPQYNSLCPMFWLTNFCIIFIFIIPIVPIIKLFKGIYTLSNIIISWINRNICIPAFEAMIRGMEDNDVLKNWTSYNYWEDNNFRTPSGLRDKETGEYNKEYLFWKDDAFGVGNMPIRTVRKSQERFQKWIAVTPDWKIKIEEIKAKRKSEYEQRVADATVARKARWKKQQDDDNAYWNKKRAAEAKSEASKVRRQAMFTKIAVYTKWLAYPVVAAFVVMVGWVLYVTGRWLYNVVPWTKIWNNILIVLPFVGLVLLGLASIILLGLIIYKLVAKCDFKPSDSKTIQSIGKGLLAVGHGIVWFLENIIGPIIMFIWNWIITPIGTFFGWMWEGIKFIGMFLKSTKDGYCPGIRWTDNSDN